MMEDNTQQQQTEHCLSELQEVVDVIVTDSDSSDEDDSDSDEDDSDDEEITTLHEACLEGDVDEVKEFLKTDPDVELLDDLGWTPLHRAISGGSLEVVKYLIEERGADEFALCGKDGYTALHIAADWGRLDILKYLYTTYYQQQADDSDEITNNTIDIRTKVDDWTPLHFACKEGHRHVAEYLIQQAGADAQARNSFGYVPLHMACTLDRCLDVAKYLIEECRVPSDVKDDNGFTPVHNAASKGGLKIVQYLMEECVVGTPRDKDGWVSCHCIYCISPRAKSSPLVALLVSYCRCRLSHSGANPFPWFLCKQTPLHMAAKEGHLAVVKYLVQEQSQRVDYTRDNERRSPLHFAAMRGHKDLCKYLMEECESDVDVWDKHGRSALHHAVLEGHLDLIECFIEKHDADAEVVDDTHSTCLHMAASTGQLHVLRYLIGRDLVDANAVDVNTYTALHTACAGGYLDVAKYLIEDCNFDVNALCTEAQTCLHLASFGGHLDMVQYLVEEHDSDPQLADENGANSLHLACSDGHMNVVKYFIEERGTNPRIRDFSGWTPLFFASGNLEVFKYLHTEHDLPTDDVDDEEWTVLHACCNTGSIDVCKYLVEDCNAALDLVDWEGKTPLWFAVEADKLDFLPYLVEHGPGSLLTADNQHWTPIHLAASNGNLDILKYLFEQVIVRKQKLCLEAPVATPLHLACRGGHLEATKYLVEEQQQDVNAKCPDGKMALHHAISMGKQLDLVTYLVEDSGVNPETPQENGARPLHLAAETNLTSVVEYLAKTRGVDVNAPDKSGMTALHLAMQWSFACPVNMLLQNGADPLAQDHFGNTPLHVAACGRVAVCIVERWVKQQAMATDTHPSIIRAQLLFCKNKKGEEPRDAAMQRLMEEEDHGKEDDYEGLVDYLYCYVAPLSLPDLREQNAPGVQCVRLNPELEDEDEELAEQTLELVAMLPVHEVAHHILGYICLSDVI